MSSDADPSTGVAVYDAQTFGDINADGVPDSGWLPGGAGGTSVASAQWAGIVALANQTRVTGGRGFLGNALNAAIYHVAQTYGTEDFNDITTGTAGTNAAAPGFDLATGWGTPRAINLITRLAQADVSTVNNNLTWNAFYRLPIVQHRRASRGPARASSSATAPPSAAPTASTSPSPPTPTSPSTTRCSPTPGSTATASSGGRQRPGPAPAPATPAPLRLLTNLTVDTLTRNDVTGKLSGTGTATVLTTSPPRSTSPPPAGGGGGTAHHRRRRQHRRRRHRHRRLHRRHRHHRHRRRHRRHRQRVRSGTGTAPAPATARAPAPAPGQQPPPPAATPSPPPPPARSSPSNFSVTGVSYRSASGKIHIRGSVRRPRPHHRPARPAGHRAAFEGKFQVT